MTIKADRSAVRLNKLRTFFSKPQNTILVIMAVICTFTTFAPIIAIVEDTLKNRNLRLLDGVEFRF